MPIRDWRFVIRDFSRFARAEIDNPNQKSQIKDRKCAKPLSHSSSSSSQSLVAPCSSASSCGCASPSRTAGTRTPSSTSRYPRAQARGEIGRALVDGGIVHDQLSFRAALYWTGASRRIKAGEYRFDRPMTAVDVIEKMARGDVYTRRITFPEGLTIQEMAKDLRGAGLRTCEGVRRLGA
jgi:hypothetical protein